MAKKGQKMQKIPKEVKEQTIVLYYKHGLGYKAVANALEIKDHTYIRTRVKTYEKHGVVELGRSRPRKRKVISSTPVDLEEENKHLQMKNEFLNVFGNEKMHKTAIKNVSYPIRVRTSALIIKNNKLLLVELNDGNGLHYNLPGGGVEQGETLVEAVRREALEEASIQIDVGKVAFLYEYAPFKNKEKYGTVHSLTTIFECELKGGETPCLSDNPDENQIGVKWIPLDELQNIVLYPNLRSEIQTYINNKRNIELMEEQQLEGYPDNYFKV